MIQCGIKVVPIKGPGEWLDKEFTDWLHPSHGPLPDLHCVAHCNGDHYTIAIWLFRNHCTTVIECPRKPSGRGSILWSSRWKVDPAGRLLSKDEEVAITQPVLQYETQEEFLFDFVPAIVEEAETTPLGTVAAERRLRAIQAAKQR